MKFTESQFRQLIGKNNTPRKARKQEETILQADCEAHLLKKKIPFVHLNTFIARKCNCGRWNSYAVEGNAGVSDLIIFTSEKTIFVELKSKKGYLSPHQKEFRDTISDTYDFHLIRNLETFKKLF